MRLNLGSGQRPFGEGWTNVDKQERWNPDIVADMTSMPMFADASAEMIVIHHGLEHLDLTSADNCLRECYRILKPNGELIVTVPDLYALTRAWIDGKIDDYIFCVNLHGAWMGDDSDVHRWSYTYKTLMDKIRKVGFKSVVCFNWRDIPGASIARDWWICAVEAIKTP